MGKTLSKWNGSSNPNKKSRKNNTKKEQQHRRAKVTGRVYIHDDTSLYIAPMNNLSAGGVFIDGLTSLELGSDVRVVIKSPEIKSPLQVKGKVVRVEDEERCGMAVEFTSLPEETQDHIQHCVFRLRTKQQQSKVENVIN